MQTLINLVANMGEARFIAFYGVKPLPPPYQLPGSKLDDHFVFPVHRHVEEVNLYFREKLHALLSRETGLGGRQGS